MRKHVLRLFLPQPDAAAVCCDWDITTLTLHNFFRHFKAVYCGQKTNWIRGKQQLHQRILVTELVDGWLVRHRLHPDDVRLHSSVQRRTAKIHRLLLHNHRQDLLQHGSVQGIDVLVEGIDVLVEGIDVLVEGIDVLVEGIDVLVNCIDVLVRIWLQFMLTKVSHSMFYVITFLVILDL